MRQTAALDRGRRRTLSRRRTAISHAIQLIALAARPPTFAAAAAERIARDAFGVVGMASPLAGERDQNFCIRPTLGAAILLKILGPEEAVAGVEFQTAALEHIALVDPALPVPRIIRTRGGGAYAWISDDAGVPHIARALTFGPGRTLAGTLPERALLRDLGAVLARLDLGLANFFHPAAGQRIAWDLRRCVELRAHTPLIDPPAFRHTVERLFDAYIERLPQLARLRAQLIHNDVHPGNVLVRDDLRAIIGILDFGDMIHAPRIFEIAVTAAETGGRDCTPIDAAAEIVAGYTSVTPLDEAEYPALYDAILMRHAISATIHAWRSVHDPTGAAKLGNLSAASRPAIAALSAAGRDAVVARWRAAAASPTYDRASPDACDRLVARRHQLLGRGLELSYAHPVHVVRGEGVFLYDAHGQRLLDAYNNVAAVGHAHPRVVAAVARQIGTLNTNTRYVNAMVLDYAERISATLTDGLGCCLFVNSGSEANDVAWRIAQAVTGRRGAIVMADAYHGISDAVAALSPYYGTRAQPLAPHVEALEAPDPYRGRLRGDARDAGAGYAADAQRAIGALAARGYAVAAFFVDSAFVSNGILDAPPGYLAAVVATIRAAGGLIVADEVQAGFGRCGDAFWGFTRHGIVPDIVTLGKPMGNGYPVGAAVTRSEILQTFTDRIEFFSTFGGNPVGAAACLATLDVIVDNDLQTNAAQTGNALRAGIRDLATAHPMIGDVRGSGLLIGVEIVSDPVHRTPAPAWAKHIANAMRDAGVLIGTEGPAGNVLKIRPPLPFGPQHIPLVLAALAAALARLPASDDQPSPSA